MLYDAQYYEVIAEGFTRRLEGVAPEAFDQVSTCPEWRVRDLVAHVVSNHRRALDRLEASESAVVDPDGDLVTAWHDARARLLAALGDESLAATVVRGRFGAQRFDEMVAGLLATDTLVHTWDLARSTAQDDALDEASVARACEFVASFGHAIRGPGGLGPVCASAPDADVTTRLLNLCGRTVAPRGDPPD